MKKIFGIIFVSLIISVVSANAINVSQRWDKTYDIGGETWAFSIQQTFDGG